MQLWNSEWRTLRKTQIFAECGVGGGGGGAHRLEMTLHEVVCSTQDRPGEGERRGA
jgi:hypothetical protein